MNRRGFLRAVGIGAVGALVAARVPASVIDRIGLHELSRDRIRDQMRRIYNENVQKVGPYPSDWKFPHEIHLGRQAYETYEGELVANERFGPYASPSNDGEEFLWFKAAKVRRVGEGWTMRFAG